jgi:hypothetical protein
MTANHHPHVGGRGRRLGRRPSAPRKQRFASGKGSGRCASDAAGMQTHPTHLIFRSADARFAAGGALRSRDSDSWRGPHQTQMPAHARRPAPANAGDTPGGRSPSPARCSCRSPPVLTPAPATRVRSSRRQRRRRSASSASRSRSNIPRKSRIRGCRAKDGGRPPMRTSPTSRHSPRPRTTTESPTYQSSEESCTLNCT